MKLMKREYTVIYEKGARNWSAYVPDLPGCVGAAKSQAQLAHVMREAIEFHIEGLLAHGEKVPEPSVEAGTVRVVA